MGIFLNTVLARSNCQNNEKYSDFIIDILGRNNPDYDFDNLDVIDGYIVLPIYDEKIDSIKIGINIANNLNVLTISIFSYDSDYVVFQLVDVPTTIRIVFNKDLALSYGCNLKDQNVDHLINYVDGSISKDDIKRIINEEYIFAEDGLSKILDLFHINFNEIVY